MSETYGGIPPEKLYLVRVQSGLDGARTEEGALILDRNGSKRADSMNTFHFALNGVVGNHAMGKQFDGSQYTIIAPLEDACKTAGNIPSGLNPVDTYFHADAAGRMKLPQAIILAPEGASVPEGLETMVRRYPAGATPEESMKNRNYAVRQVFAELDAPTRSIGDHYWHDARSPSQSESQSLAQRLCGNKEVSFDLAFYAQSHVFERLSLQAASAMNSYKNGDRLEQKDSGQEVPLLPEVKQRMEDLKEFIAERKNNHADPKSVAFYERSLAPLVARFENETLPIHRAELRQSLASEFHVSLDGKEKIGPLNADALVERIKSGDIQPNHLVWRPGMAGWKPLAATEDHATMKEIAKIDQSLSAQQKPILASRFMAPPDASPASVKNDPVIAAPPKAKAQSLRL